MSNEPIRDVHDLTNPIDAELAYLVQYLLALPENRMFLFKSLELKFYKDPIWFWQHIALPIIALQIKHSGYPTGSMSSNAGYERFKNLPEEVQIKLLKPYKAPETEAEAEPTGRTIPIDSRVVG